MRPSCLSNITLKFMYSWQQGWKLVTNTCYKIFLKWQCEATLRRWESDWSLDDRSRWITLRTFLWILSTLKPHYVVVFPNFNLLMLPFPIVLKLHHSRQKYIFINVCKPQHEGNCRMYIWSMEGKLNILDLKKRCVTKTDRSGSVKYELNTTDLMKIVN